MRKSRNLLAVGLLSAMFMMNGGTAWAGDATGTIYHGGKIYTMQEAKVDANNRLVPISKDTEPVMAEFVVTKNGKIEYVGEVGEAIPDEYLTKEYKKVDLKGKVMYPGFVDGHSHFPLQGEDDLTKVNLRSPLFNGTVHTIVDLQNALKARAEALNDPDIPIIGYCYDDTLLFAEDAKTVYGHPTAKDLDCVPNPVYIKHISNHVAVVNTPVLTKFKVADYVGKEGYDGVVAVDGNPTGLLLETVAMSTVDVTSKQYPKLTDPGTNATLARATDVYAAAGVTTADNGGSVYLSMMPAWQAALASGDLGVRVISHPFGYYPGTEMGDLGVSNRMALGWTGEVPGTDVPNVGADITDLDMTKYPGYGAYMPSVPEGIDKERIFLGAWKFIFDGSPQAYTAWMKNPGFYDWGKYDVKNNDTGFATATNPNYSFKAENFSGLPGTMNISIDEMAQYIDMYHQHGYSTETHTNGSAAAEAWVSIIEDSVRKHADKGITDTRHTSIHGQTLERQHIERMTGNYDGLAKTAHMYTDLMGAGAEAAEGKDLGKLPQLMKDQNIFTSFFNNHVYFYGDRHHNIFFGPGRAMNISPSGWAQAYGMPYSFHNDTDVTPISPLRSIQTGVTRATAGGIILSKENKDNDPELTFKANQRKDKPETEREFWAYDHRVSALQAIHAVTTGPAWQNKLENKIGKIAPEMLADFVIMDKDIIQQAEEDPTKIADMRIAATIVGDEVIYGVLPESDQFAFDAGLSGNQPFPNIGSAAKVNEAEPLSKKEAEQMAHIKGKETVLGAASIEVSLTGVDTVVLSFKILGNDKPVSDIELRKLRKGQKPGVFTPLATVEGEESYVAVPISDMTPQSWWISDADHPMEAMGDQMILKKDMPYTINFVVQDNDKGFDLNSEPGIILDPAGAISKSGTMPDNGAKTTEEANKQDEGNKSSGGSSGGCTVGTNPAYELLALLLAALGVTAARGLRRRDA